MTGRDAGRLEETAGRHAGLLTFVADMGDPSAREALASQVLEVLPALSMVINNAGIQRRIPLAADTAPWSDRQAEIDVLLAGPIHLNSLLVPMMLDADRDGTIVNVTSAGAYLPQPFAPVYSACKAALHSATMTLRHALLGTRIRVMELVPPAVATGLAGPGATHGAPLDEFCDAVFPRILEGDDDEIGFGPIATEGFEKPRATYREMFEAASTRFPIATYACPRR